ncbi:MULTISPECIES: GreA/GreB family elongation factor [Vibrio]|mgnify:CR=1 FL=1|jgi:transcription elongation GreA/GreB family factor|nr:MULTISPECIES: GreA/GreB family elongation factor [Vibrio]KAB0460933.1 GreA/GreB family elongation factor [Vibrio kanaloae]NAZ96079.1 hypothetical protein [Vibrio toranzoniae]TKF02474.1 GreA/GreB family elongation factor [Vibrio kanaloae]UIJ40603.1 GreA/GreB family elongation factor [Vibrio kanaloae]
MEDIYPYDNFDIKRRANIGDRVKFFDEERNKSYQIILVSNKKSNPNDGLISIYSYLGSSIFRLSENDNFELYIFGEKRKYKIKNISHEKTINNKR